MEIKEVQVPDVGGRISLRSLVVIPGVLVFLLLVYFVSTSFFTQSYQGKTVDEWFWGTEGHPGRQRTHQEAKIAFKAMGASCLPYLIERARANEFVFYRWYCELHPKLPEIVRKWTRPAIPAAYIQQLALSHLLSLEINDPQLLDPYRSQLMEIVSGISDPTSRRAAFSLVARGLGRSTDKAQNIKFLLAFSNDSNFVLRLEAMMLLSEIDHSITNGIPTLTTALTNRSLIGSSLVVPTAPGEDSIVQLNRVVDEFQERAFEALARVAPKLVIDYGNPRGSLNEWDLDPTYEGPPITNR